METTSTQPIVKILPKKVCAQCNNEFETSNIKAKFCSDSCRSKAHRNLRRNGASDVEEVKESPRHSTQLVASLNGLPPQAQYIITHLKEQLSDSKEEMKRLRDKYETEKKLSSDLKEKIAKIEVDHRIEALENAKPSGLQGIVQNLGNIPPEVMAQLGPALGKLVDRLFGGSVQPQLQVAGTDGQLDSNTQAKVQAFNNWFASLAEPLQEVVYAMLVKLANSPSEEALQNNVTRILNLLNNGAGTPTIPFTGTFN
jgi:DNA repair exonuclease SbcCD ATPase subunit